MTKMKYIPTFLFLFFTVTQIHAGELNAKVSVNSDRIQSPNKNVFTSMEQAMTRLINETKWSSVNLTQNERIDCTFSLTVTQQVSDNSFKAELFIQSRRPVYNASYVTPTLNYRDTKLEFEYMENQPLEFTQTMIDNNLVATLAFYCQLILAQDFDSFSPFGGSVFYQEAQNMATQAQSNPGWSGWSAFDDNRSRTSIINAFLGEAVKPYREFWYAYHRKGLDEMAANPDRGRTTILNALPVLKEIRNVRNSEVLLQMFADCKLNEIVSIASNATAEEKKNTYDLLRSIFPASSTDLEPLRK
ncbi:MAG: DUF4835 family protein [Dysgonamonadaceae bacterium]|jgi:hypothetical protein|nr:DUF4835 family protein [Dysgonamonadaceae bacterium]